MSETETTPTPETPNTNGRCGKGEGNCRGGHRRGRGFRRFFGAALFIGCLVGVPWAVAHAAGGHGFGGGCHGNGAPKTAEELREHMGKGAGFMLNKVDATPEQEAQVDAVLDRVAPELFALKDDKEALHQDIRAALTAPEVNADEVELLRKEGLQLADDASKIVIGGILEIARALTPEQRIELADAAAKFHRA